MKDLRNILKEEFIIPLTVLAIMGVSIPVTSYLTKKDSEKEFFRQEINEYVKDYRERGKLYDLNLDGQIDTSEYRKSLLINSKNNLRLSRLFVRRTTEPQNNIEKFV